MAETITIEQYMAKVPDCCAMKTIEEHQEIMLCWGLLAAVKANLDMNCGGCEYNTAPPLPGTPFSRLYGCIPDESSNV